MATPLRSATVLLTGAAGFLGSHLTDALLQSGAQVYGVDNLVTGRLSNLESALTHPSFHLIQANAIDTPESYLPAHVRFTHILHFASPASPPRYQAHPLLTWQVNTYGTQRLLEFARTQSHPPIVLFASTSEVYGDPLEHPQPESYFGNVNPNGIRSCYDESKRAGEAACGIYYRAYQLDARIIRIFNTYGPRMDPADGRVVPQFMTQALAKKPLTMYGDGRQTRSMCYVSDLIAGILSVLTTPSLAGETFNLGSDDEITMTELAQAIWQEINGVESAPLVTYMSSLSDDPARRQPNLNLAHELLKFSPKVTLQAGLSETAEYFRKL